MRTPREYRVKSGRTWGDVEVGDIVGRGWKVVGIRHLGDRMFFHLVYLDDGTAGSVERSRDDLVEEFRSDPDVNSNPKKGVTYLAIMPRHRKPKSVPKSHIGFYQRQAREFYEAPGMTAAEARQAIKDGILQPTWVKGKPVVAYSAETGEGRTETRIFLSDLMKQVSDAGDRSALLRIGEKVYQPQYSFQPRHMYRPGGSPGGSSMTWHLTHLSGFTYDPSPLTAGQLERHLRNGDSWEMAWIQEDYNGLSMAGIVVLAKSGLKLDRINDESIRTRLHDLGGRRFRTTQVVDGGRLKPADIEFAW